MAFPLRDRLKDIAAKDAGVTPTRLWVASTGDQWVVMPQIGQKWKSMILSSQR